MELKDIFNNDQIPEDLLNMQTYLQGARRTPDIRMADFPDGGMTGAYFPAKNLIAILDGMTPKETQNTAMHEYTHATKNQMNRQYEDTSWKAYNNNPSVTRLDQLFKDAYQKLIYPTSVSTANVVDPEYRWTNRNEARAYGISNMNIPEGNKMPDYVPPHYDASSAQEHAILLNLAQRAATQTRYTPPTWMDQLKNLFK